MSLKILLPATILLLMFSLPGFAQGTVSVRVYPEIKRQRIQSIGGNYYQTRYTNNAWDSTGEETLKQFRPGFERVALPLSFRNEQYSDYKGEKITKHHLIISLLQYLKRMKYEYGVRSFTISLWDVPDNLVEDSSRRSQRIVKPESCNELLDMLVAFFLKAKNDCTVG